jgi:hypothetical protein
MLRPLLLRLILGSAVVAPAVSHADQRYEIRLTRPQKAGDRYDVAKQGTAKRIMVVSGPAGELRRVEHALAIELEATVTILKVDDQGRPLKKSLAVRRCRVTENGKVTEPVGSGKVIIAQSRGGRTEISLESGDLSKPARAALDVVVATYSGGPADDEIFGTAQPRAVGESWPISAAAAAKDAAARDIAIREDDIQGRMRLVRIEKQGPRTALRLAATMDIRGFTLKKMKLPDGVAIDTARATAVYDALVPIDPALPQLQSAHSMTLDMAMKSTRGNAEGHTVTIHLEMSAKQSVTLPEEKP